MLCLFYFISLKYFIRKERSLAAMRKNGKIITQEETTSMVVTVREDCGLRLE